jgi:hypothetical protein
VEVESLTVVAASEEKDSIGVGEGTDGFVHVFREIDDGGLASLSVCGKVSHRGPPKDTMRMCVKCAIWMFEWAGSDDPEEVFARLSTGKR